MADRPWIDKIARRNLWRQPQLNYLESAGSLECAYSQPDIRDVDHSTKKTGTKPMNRTELNRPVLVTGPSFLGLETTCVLEPVRDPGIYMKLPTGNAVPLSEMTLGVNRLFRFLTLRWRKSVLRIPEHLLGLIFNLGLDGVLIIPQQFRLPYDGRAKIFWEAIRPALRQSGNFDWFTVPAPLTVTDSPDRYIKIFPAERGCKTFKFDINVSYPELGEVKMRGVAGEKGQIEQLSSARPFIRNRRLQAFASFARSCGWPQGEIAVSLTSDTDEAKTALLEELCWHRLLDMLGSFMAVCPQGGRIAGLIETRRVGHAVDIELMRQIKKTSWVKV
jgi:UDP-3-O-acyl-N-acetylglucosamine deacetylase